MVTIESGWGGVWEPNTLNYGIKKKSRSEKKKKKKKKN